MVYLLIEQTRKLNWEIEYAGVLHRVGLFDIISIG